MTLDRSSRQYFEAATERVDAEDVMAGARVTEQGLQPTRRRLRPAWAAALGFAGVLVLVGGALVAGLLMRDPAAVAPRLVGSPATGSGGSWGWWPLVVAGAAITIGLIALVFSRLRRVTKEVDMTTLDEKQQKTSEPGTPHRSRRAWFVGMAVLVVLAGAVTTWAIVEANRTSDVEIATELADEWTAGWNASDPEAIAAVFAEDVRDEQLALAQLNAISISNVGRTSELWATDAERTFGWTAEFDLTGYTYAGEWEIELDGDLAARIDGEWSLVDVTQLYSEDPES